MAAKRRTLRTILQSSASRKAFRFVSKDELTRVGLSPNTKLLVPKGLKRVTIKTAAIKPSELKKVAKARGAKREKLLERAASKIVKLANAEKTTATNKRAVRQERPQEFTALFIAKVQADVARGTSIKKAGGKNRGKFSL